MQQQEQSLLNTSGLYNKQPIYEICLYTYDGNSDIAFTQNVYKS